MTKNQGQSDIAYIKSSPEPTIFTNLINLLSRHPYFQSVNEVLEP